MRQPSTVLTDPFAEFLDTVDDVERFAALGVTEQGTSGTQFRIDYLKPSGAIGFYHPDWVVVLNTKGCEVNCEFALDQQQRDAWFKQIVVMKETLATATDGHILFELMIPRMGKRADVVLLLEAAILVIEFKVGAVSFDRAAVEHVHDYALDLADGSIDIRQSVHSCTCHQFRTVAAAIPDFPLS